MWTIGSELENNKWMSEKWDPDTEPSEQSQDFNNQYNYYIKCEYLRREIFIKYGLKTRQ